MSKKFIDSNLFEDSWVDSLSLEAKMLYIYLLAKCDHAGVIDFNIRHAEFATRVPDLANRWQTLSEEFGNRIQTLKGNYLYLSKYVDYQYPRGLSPASKPQKAVIDRLLYFSISHPYLKDLPKGYGNPSQRVQDIDKDIDKDREGGVGETRSGDYEGPPSIEVFPCPLQTPEFHAAWAKWLVIRHEKGFAPIGPMSQLTRLEMLADLGSYRHALETVKHSTVNAWANLHPTKLDPACLQPPTANSQQPAIREPPGDWKAYMRDRQYGKIPDTWQELDRFDGLQRSIVDHFANQPVEA